MSENLSVIQGDKDEGHAKPSNNAKARDIRKI
jgi:hypothetical protein